MRSLKAGTKRGRAGVEQRAPVVVLRSGAVACFSNLLIAPEIHAQRAGHGQQMHIRDLGVPCVPWPVVSLVCVEIR